jgi:hypothetical protein
VLFRGLELLLQRLELAVPALVLAEAVGAAKDIWRGGEDQD